MCMMGITEHVPQKTQKKRSSPKIFPSSPPKKNFIFIITWSLKQRDSANPSEGGMKADTMPAPQEAAMGFRSDLGISAVFPRAQGPGNPSQPIFSLAPKGAWPCNPFKPPKQPRGDIPRKTGVVGSAAEGRPQGAAALHRE